MNTQRHILLICYALPVSPPNNQGLSNVFFIVVNSVADPDLFFFPDPDPFHRQSTTMNSIWNGKDAVKLLQNVHALVLNRINFMILVLDLSSMVPIFFLSVSLSVSFCLSLFLAIPCSLCFPVYLFLCLPVILSLYLSLCVSLSFSYPSVLFFSSGSSASLHWPVCPCQAGTISFCRVPGDTVRMLFVQRREYKLYSPVLLVPTHIRIKHKQMQTNTTFVLVINPQPPRLPSPPPRPQFQGGVTDEVVDDSKSNKSVRQGVSQGFGQFKSQ